jgi:hypothetical protein
MPARAALLVGSLITAATLGAAEQSRGPQFTATDSVVELRVATIHAATLTSHSASRDSIDTPYLLVSVVGPRAKSQTLTLPPAGHWQIHRDEALGARPLHTVRLGDGDSVRVLVTLMDGGRADRSAEDRAATEAASSAAANASERNRIVSAAVEPLLSRGARWIGSATLLLTREAGVSYWRGLDCIARCKVVSGAASASLDAPGTDASSGVIELSGAGATYHMKLEARQPH